MGLARGGLPEGGQPVKRPGENVPAGMLKLTLHGVELETPGLCFCVLKIGPHWGRTKTLMASPKAVWDWEVGVCCLLCFRVCSCTVLAVLGSSLCAWVHAVKYSGEQYVNAAFACGAVYLQFV